MIQAPQDPDSLVVEQLRKAGADLAKPTEVVVYLYFPSETIAAAAGRRLQELGVAQVEVSASIDGSWLCKGTVQMVPELHAIRQLTARSQRVADELGGEYDGWEAAVQPGGSTGAPPTLAALLAWLAGAARKLRLLR